MKLEEFTLEQQHAVTAEGSNVLVSAGAGSGKTQVLTARVVYFVKKGYKLNEFLILTFTKLAAGEMKDRIRKQLNEEGLKEAANQVDSANICTFDSYALNLVKKYHFLLGVSPNVSIIDKTIIDVKKREIIDDIFERLYKDRDPEFCSMIEHYCVKSDDDIRQLVLKIYDKAILDSDTKRYLDGFVGNYYSEKTFEGVTSLMEDYLKSLQRTLERTFNEVPPTCCTKNKDNPMPIPAFAQDVFSIFLKAEKYDDMVASFKNIDPADFANIPTTNKNWSKENKSLVMSLKNLIKKIDNLIKSLPSTKKDLFEDLKETEPAAKVLVRIIRELDERILAYKNEKGVYEFSDIAKMASKLVEDHEEVREEIKSSLKMIMIDEYQDTSSLQDDFIKLISDNNVYMVGDVKQSIYRFRNANVSIFIDKYRDYKNNGTGQVIDLNKNFRSRREVLDDINFIFKQLMTEKCGGADYRNEHMIQYGNKNYEKDQAGDKGIDSHTRILEYIVNDTKKNPEAEAEAIAEDIIDRINHGYKVMEIDKDKKPTLRPAEFKDFCILMDRGTNFDVFQKVFNEMKVPIYVENDEDISTNEMIMVLKNLLKMVNFIIKNDFSGGAFEKTWLSLARSFVFSYDDEKIYKIFKTKDLENEGITAKVREIVLDNISSSSYELFEKVVFGLDIYSKCISLGNVEKNHKYLDYFLGMFKTMGDLGYTISDFSSFMENIGEYSLPIKISSTGTTMNSVKLMNIHKSKGLEFNIVYFAGHHKEFNRMDLMGSCGMSAPFGLIMPKNPKKANVVKIANTQYELNEDTSEKIRQLYVCLTRTREQLIIPWLVPSFSEAYEGEMSLEDDMRMLGINDDAFDPPLLEENDSENETDYDEEPMADDEDTTEEGENEEKEEIYSPQEICQFYVDGKIDYDVFVESLRTIHRLEPTMEFLSMGEEEKHSIQPDDFYEYFEGVGSTIEHAIDDESFRDMLKHFINHSKFVKYHIPLAEKPLSLKNPPAEVKHANLKIEDFKIEYKINQVSRASKQLSLSANKEALDFGTKMHFLLETTNFNNPNLSDMDMNEKHIIERFLHSPFMSNIKEGKAYKEYEYHDDLNNVNGTIDLMVIYDDHIDVIDYKTKNIDDASYDKQIGIYMDYVQRTFRKKVNGYLYSLLTGEYKTY